ncbi:MULTISPECIES: hypothetical protein [Pseudomonas]|uniref:hypothetical protein n=1 Tax=Pseudomonas TaxID=286 RepID=UPI0006B949A3|nr:MULTISPECIES: hypothetical protein [Pseudomonas]MCH5650920.1 hypothetical protein [Pseudomonas syringae]MCK9690985.1 hypothetical protein [Pseudomonas syringae pv. syringae]MCK9712866.1 hypothetical protein [Pseudomonas syringae pv. syringae]MCK9750972.1 hypothetical protein [Pseudomonas syringae pv. syringae]MCZ0948788.1 hypothetical protein [Pseudomonas syringae pv. tomato]
MNQHFYTTAERIQQLRQLERGLANLVPFSILMGLAQTPHYEDALRRTRILLETGFNQADLTSLARAIPDVFHRGRDWEAQYLVKKPDGSWGFSEEYLNIQARLGPVMRAVDALRTLGYY